MCMVPAGRAGAADLRRSREVGSSSDGSNVLGVFSRSSLAAKFPYFGGRLYFGAGPDLHASGLAAVSDAFCRGGTHGADRLPHAIGAVHSVLLSLHNRAVWTGWAGAGISPHRSPLRGAGAVQQLVVDALSFWADGVAVARIDLWEAPLHVQGRGYTSD